MGLPNCSRILAYAEAVSVAQRATPMDSADSSVDISARARVRLRLLSTRSSPTSTALARTWASGRSGSTLLTGSISSCVGVEHHPLFAAVDGHRQHQHRRLRRGGNRAHLAADDQAVAVPGGGQPGVDRVGGDHLAGRQVVEQLGVGVVGRDQRAGDRRRDERAGHRAVAELGQHDGQFENAEALSANGFRKVHALQTLLGRGLPVRRRVRDGGFEGFVQDLRRRHPRHQGPHRIGQVVVLRSDRDGHALIAFPINRSVGTETTR